MVARTPKGFPMLRASGCLALSLLLPLPALAATVTTPAVPLTRQQKLFEDAGTGIAIALPLIAAGITVRKHDRRGFYQLVTETVLTVGTAYALKQIVRERRPDGSDWQSFPSETSALSASGSSFLWRRYGWQYGLPAAAASGFVGWSRTQANKHHWYDTLASSAIAGTYAHFVTTRMEKRYNIRTELEAAPDGAVVRMSYNF
jgi:membrane-associated phospholipid phosphatase